MSRLLTTTASLALLVATSAACSTADDDGGSGSVGSNGSNGPFSVQPQPIPDDGFAGRLEGTSFTVATSSDGLTVSGVSSRGAAPGESQGGAQVSALDLTTAGAVVTGDADASGVFTLDIAGGTVGDRVLVFLDSELTPGAAFEVPTATPAGAAPPCVLVDGSNSAYLGKSPVGVAAVLAVTFSSSCGAALTVDGISFAGDPIIAAPAPGFVVPISGASASETFLVEPTSTAGYLSFVILASGADRHVFTLTGTGD